MATRVVSFESGSMLESNSELLDVKAHEAEGRSLAFAVSDGLLVVHKVGRDEGSLLDWMTQEDSLASEAAS